MKPAGWDPSCEAFYRFGRFSSCGVAFRAVRVGLGRVALRSALEALEEGALASFGLRAGVGIATGSAFVGNIQAVDRAIWSVLGNTTNLAARLGGLTRDFQVPIVIDEATRRGAGPVADDFERERGVMVKGREDELNVYLLREVRAARRAA